ncbi:MAG: GAF domain-containing protein [Synechococcales bacterium]|nr:GAF domain-containing protein [Synechococcales bacterium]
MSQDQLIAELLERIAVLDQENAKLRSELAAASVSGGNVSSGHVSGGHGNLCQPDPQARVVQLEKANKALQQSLVRLATDGNLDLFLGHVLTEIIQQVTASSGHIFLFDAQKNTLELRISVRDDQICYGTRPDEPELFQAPFSADITPAFQHLCEQRSILSLNDAEFGGLAWPGTVEWFQRDQVAEAIALALMAGDRPVGLLGLRFTTLAALSPEEMELIYALTHQATLAIEITRVSEEAKQAAILKEQEKAAQARATELTKANNVLKHNIDCLVNISELDQFVGYVLLEITKQLQVANCALFLYNKPSHVMQFYMGVSDGEILTESNLQVYGFELFAEPIPAEKTQAWTMLVQGHKPEVVNLDHCEMYACWGETIPWHLQKGHRATLCFPLKLASEPWGFLGLAFYEVPNVPQEKLELMQALVHQLALALHLTRIAEEKHQAALAHEREKAAQAQAAALQKINQELHQSRRRLQDLLNTMSDWAWEVDADINYTFVDEKVFKILGYRPEELLGQSPFTFMPTEEAARVSAIFAPIAAERKPFRRLENLHLTKDGRRVIFETSGTPIFDPQGNFLGYRGVDCDVTQLREIQEALLRAEQKRTAELTEANEFLQSSLQKLAEEPELEEFLGHMLTVCSERFGAMEAGIWRSEEGIFRLFVSYENQTIKLQNGISHPGANRAIAQNMRNQDVLARLRKRELVIDYEEDFATAEVYEQFRDYFKQRGIKSAIKIPMFLDDVLQGILVLRFGDRHVLPPEEAELAHALANQAVLALELTRLAEVAKKTAIVEERNRMARDIHDNLAQTFTSILMRLQTAILTLSDNHPEAQAYINHACDLAREGLANARRSVHALRPQLLENQPLSQALADCLRRMTTGTQVQGGLQTVGDPYPLPLDVESELFHIGQEAITNACKHAQAQQIQVILTFSPHRVGLTVRDDGIGFSLTPSSTEKGFGLISMQERAQRIGGQITITSRLHQGTEVVVVLPPDPPS